MGMYDSIDCHYPLPMPEDPKGYTGSYGFQTKDFDCGLDIYVIDKDGRLFIEQRETELVEGDPNSKNFLDRLTHQRTVKTWLEALDNTCTIEFHDYITSNNTDYDYWIQYKATFIRGQLSDVKLTNFEATCNFKRKKSDEEFKIKLGQRRDFVGTWRYKFIYHPYNTVLRATVRETTRCLGKVNTLIYKLESKIRI